MPELLDRSRISAEVVTWLRAAGLSVKASYRVDEVARLLSCGERQVHKYIARGAIDRLAINPVGARRLPTRIPVTSLISWFEDQ